MIKIYFDNNLIDNESYYSLENSHDLINGNFSLGSTASNTYKISVDSSTITTIPSKVDIYEDEVQIASLYVDSITKEEQQITLNLVDQLTLMNTPYDAKPLIDSTGREYATLLEIANDICSKFNLTLGTTDFYGYDKHISYYDNSIYARDYIGYIAELNSGYAYVENNTLYFKKQKTTSSKLININDCEKLELGEKHLITKVVYDIGTDIWEHGDTTGDTLYLNSSNVYIQDEDDVEHIYNDINGFEFYSLDPNNCPISNIKSGDVITFVDGETLYQTIANVSRSYFGQWYGKYSLQVNSVLQEETKAMTPNESVKTIKTIVNRQTGELQILSREVGEMEKNLSVVKDKSGNPIVVDDAGAYELQSIEIQGLCSQSSTPTPSTPVEVKTIKGVSIDGKTYIKQKTTQTIGQATQVNTALIDLNKYDENKTIIGSYELNSIGDTYDTFKDGVLTKRIGKIVLDGTETWTTNSVSSTISRFHTPKTDVLVDDASVNVISSYFTGTSMNNRNVDIENYIFNYTGYIAINTNVATNVNDFKTWLSNNNVVVYYILKEEETYNLDYERLALFKGKNTITLEEELLPTLSIQYLVDSIFNEQYVNQSQFNIKNDEISSEVSKSVSLSQDAINGLSNKLDTSTYTDFYNTQYTKFVEDSNKFQMEFNNTYKGKINGNETTINEMKNYITFEDGNIVLNGYIYNEETQQQEKAQFELKIEKDRIGIYKDGTLISSWVQNVFEVEQINMGKFAFIPRSNGSLSFRKVK